jgi:outer membrane protein assembly factor BamB
LEFDDVSRYSVRVRRGSVEWTNEVIGQPQFFPLKERDIIAASKRIIVLNKEAKKLWESPLNFDIAAQLWTEPGEEPSRYGAGPCVEQGGALYIIDQGVLTAFDAATGNARWRLPSVGIAGIYFDDQGMMYVNTTTASLNKIKYSQQIDVTDRTHNQILKIDPATGKTLWENTKEGMINYLSGEYIYTVDSHEGDDEADRALLAGIPGATMPPHIRIKRLNAKTGRVMWEHYQRRAPIDIQIDKNTIQILFRKEMQVLKYVSL